MQRPICCALIGVMFTAAAMAAGPQPLIQTLPEDGAWAQYHVVLRIQQQEEVLEWYLRSVGKEQAGGVDCRWIEFEERNSSTERPQQTFKLLIAEDRFGPNRHPLSEPRRILYRRNPGDEVVEVGSITEVDFGLPLMLAGISGESQEASEPASVDWSRGRLECRVFTGRSNAEIGDAKAVVDQRQLRSHKAPFGIGSITQDWSVAVNEQLLTARVEIVLKDYGAEAKSVLP